MSDAPPADGGAEDRPDAASISADSLPDGWEDMSQAEREAWAEEREQELTETADEAARLSDEEREALDALSEPIETRTARVTLNGVEVEVKTYLDADREDALNRIEANRRDLPAVRGTIAETLAWLIEDERYGGETGEKVWRAFAENYGVSSLAEVFYEALDPALERMENSEAAQKFREDGPRSGNLSGGR